MADKVNKDNCCGKPLKVADPRKIKPKKVIRKRQ